MPFNNRVQLTKKTSCHCNNLILRFYIILKESSCFSLSHAVNLSFLYNRLYLIVMKQPLSLFLRHSGMMFTLRQVSCLSFPLEVQTQGEVK